MTKPNLDDVAQMSDTELTHSLKRLIRVRGWGDCTQSVSDAHWLIEAMARRGLFCETNNDFNGGWFVAFGQRNYLSSDELVCETSCAFSDVDRDPRKLTFCRAVSEAALRASRSLKAYKAAQKKQIEGTK